MKVLVIGGGAVGLSCAAQLAQAGQNVVVVERHNRLGAETSSRNSGVIHTGIYYPTASLKARLCVQGRAMLLRFCERRRVPYRLCGKLIVAAKASDVPELERLSALSRANGVEVPLQQWSAAQIQSRFTNVRGAAALWSAGSGIVDSHKFIAALGATVQRRDGVLLLGTTVQRLTVGRGGWHVRLQTGSRDEDHTFDAVVNAAGHGAERIAELAEVVAPTVYAVKGNYYSVAGLSPADALVYPLPNRDLIGLGVHLTIDLAGRARLGPDVQLARSSTDTAVDASLGDEFLKKARVYLPNLRREQLRPDYAGVRPKLAVGAFADFHIELAAPGFVQLSGIESPGLTACLAIGQHVVHKLSA